MKNTLDRHRFITNISLAWWTLNESTDVLRSARAATFFIIFFLMSFFSFSFLLFSSRFCWVVFKQEKERESARGQIFFSSFEHKKRKNTCSVCAVKVAQTCDIKTDHQNRRRTRFVYPPRGRFLLCTWSRFDISTRARGIYFIMVFFSFFFLWFWWVTLLFFSFFFLQKNRGGSLVLVFPEKREEKEEEKKKRNFFLSSKVFSLLFSSLFFTLLSLCAHENTSHRIFFRHTSTTHHKTLTEIASGT